MSWGEFIELHDLRLDRDQIELTSPPQAPRSPPRLERTNALRISPAKVPELLSRVGIIRLLNDFKDPRLLEEKGEGHNFQPCSHAQPTWCDQCGDFIWGLYKQSLRCAKHRSPDVTVSRGRQSPDCRFTCHHRCRALIQLDCSWDRSSTADQTCVVEHTIETDTNVALFCHLDRNLDHHNDDLCVPMCNFQIDNRFPECRYRSPQCYHAITLFGGGCGDGVMVDLCSPTWPQS